MNFRDWLIVVGLIVIVGLIIDAFRRLWFQRRLKNEITFGLQTVKGAEDYSSELPNGGARLKNGEDVSPVGFAPSKESSVMSGHDRVAPVFSDQMVMNHSKVETTGSSISDSMHASYGDAHDVSVVEVSSLQLAPASEPIIPVENWASHNDAVMVPGQANEVQIQQEVIGMSERMVSERLSSKSDNDISHSLKSEHNEVDDSGLERAVDESAPLNDEGREAGTVDSQVETFFSETTESFHEAISQPEEVEGERCQGAMPFSQGMPKEMLIIHLEAKEGSIFYGDQVLQVLLDNGMRLGEMNVFHRVRSGKYQEKDVLFSIANGMEPGTFDLKTMREENFFVLTFFMALPGPEEPVEAFKAMVDTVDIVSRHLHAEVKDDQRCQMTLQMLEYCRQKVAEFQRLQMLDHQMG